MLNRYQNFVYKCRKRLSHIIRCPSFIFKQNQVFIEEEEDNPSDKVVMVQKKLDGVDIDDIENFVNLPMLMLIRDKCGNLKVVVDDGELTTNNNRKKSSKFSKPIDVNSVANVIDEIEVSMISLVVTFLR